MTEGWLLFKKQHAHIQSHTNWIWSSQFYPCHHKPTQFEMQLWEEIYKTSGASATHLVCSLVNSVAFRLSVGIWSLNVFGGASCKMQSPWQQLDHVGCSWVNVSLNHYVWKRVNFPMSHSSDVLYEQHIQFGSWHTSQACNQNWLLVDQAALPTWLCWLRRSSI